MFKKLSLLLLTLIFFNACFLFKDTYNVPDKLLDPDNAWVDIALHQMSLDQKIGQMIMVVNSKPIYNETDPEYSRLVYLIRRYNIGGIILNHGNAFQRTRLINRLQKIATDNENESDHELINIPLFFAADFERGTGQRFNGGTEFISAMGIAATGDPQNAYKSGQITAREARAMGFHIVFAPVADVNNNPQNPVINTRSFGEDPQTVARFSTAFIKGIQDHGVLATVKHFPGHGNTSVDSHYDLPEIKGTLRDLQKTELVPFVDAIKNDVAAVMTAHIAYPDYDTDAFRPATLSPLVLDDLLRNKLQFKGLVITDAFKMGAIDKNYYGPNAAVKAIIAGVDIILMPGNIQGTFNAIREAVQDKKLSLQRIDQSIKRILKLKSRLGLHKQPFVDLDLLAYQIHQPFSLQTAKKAAREAITLVKNQDLPLSSQTDSRICLLAITSGQNFDLSKNEFITTLQNYYPYIAAHKINPYENKIDIGQICQEAASADYVINAFFIQKDADMPEQLNCLLTELDGINKPVINVVFGSPYQAQHFNYFSNYLFTYSDGADAQEAAAEALAGKNPINGKLPVTIPGLAHISSGVALPVKEVKLTKTDYHMYLPHPVYIDSLRNYLNFAIKDSAFPGCAISVGYMGKIVLQEGFGNYVYDPRSKKVTPSSIYDLASVTKVVATATTAMILYDRGLLNLDWKVEDIIPDFQGEGKKAVTVRHLLTHTSGLPGWVRFYLNLTGKERVVQEICDTDLVYPTGSKTVYSDLGMILMQRILETITQKPLDLLVRENITLPLGMKRTFYNPERGILNEVVPTEYSDFHKALVRGFVHDENTYVMGGVSGHAGLFSTVEDLSIFCQMFLNGGIYDYNRILKPETIKLFTSKQNLVEGSTRALGWDTRSEQGSMAGDFMSMRAFGHSGFTGTTIWMDPENDVFVVLLTNRVHPTRENQKIRKVRPVVHDYVMKSIVK